MSLIILPSDQHWVMTEALEAHLEDLTEHAAERRKDGELAGAVELEVQAGIARLLLDRIQLEPARRGMNETTP